MTTPHRTADFLVIRTALAAEAVDVAALHLRARSTYYPDGVPDDGTDWPAVWREAIARSDGRVLCAVRDGHLAGLASFRTPPNAPAGTVKLFQFHVDPGHWRTGTGTALHAACAQEWRASGLHTAVLDVHIDNRRAQSFYDRLGWTPGPAHPAAPDDHHLYLRCAVPGNHPGE
ncbi:GNAT family N-acetyltransferase [Streptomyces sp. KMM 9044]|uniref:GNAT family N-acetyltransferase n=1 Tax=Streptomyces sp. KMM 9044 TaxID=2744474 RepID=UPI002151D0A5|nr:GNAT family N-acetyltransferase [Streptomyces sp. KMM 9044]WAX80691.1 GNAT family N-acetyltransferase [Streptomyces sp. KMM 9044]